MWNVFGLNAREQLTCERHSGLCVDNASGSSDVICGHVSHNTMRGSLILVSILVCVAFVVYMVWKASSWDEAVLGFVQNSVVKSVVWVAESKSTGQMVMRGSFAMLGVAKLIGPIVRFFMDPFTWLCRHRMRR